LEFINADIDLVMTRLPVSMEVGMSTIDRSETDGISVGTAVIFDRDGPFGNASVVAVANAASGVDPANRRTDLSAFVATADSGQDRMSPDPAR
jgi:hypothetical protein